MAGDGQLLRALGDTRRKGYGMASPTRETSPLACARVAGFLYLVIIVFGISAEVFIRSSLIEPGDAAATASKIIASGGLFRIGFLADSIMLLCDVALAVLLYALLKPVSHKVAQLALFFRLTHAAVLTLNLLNYHAAILLLNGSSYASMIGADQVHSLSYLFLDLHAHGYDLGLLLFAAHCALVGYLIYKSRFLPKLLGVLVIAASATYFIGSYTRFLFPDHFSAVSQIYGVAIVSEVSLCLWLLVKGVNVPRWKERAGELVAT